MRSWLGRLVLWTGLVLGGAAFGEEDDGAAVPPAPGVQEWRTQSGYAFTGVFREYRWSERALLVEVDGETVPIPGQDLDLRSKLRLLLSDPFQESYLAHRDELRLLPDYRLRMQQLERLGAVFLAVYVSGFIAVSWFLAGVMLKDSSLSRWFKAVLAFVGLTLLAGTAVAWCFDQYGKDQANEYYGIALATHTVLYIFVVWLIYRSGFLRAFFWYVWNWIVGLLLPVTLSMTGLAAQVYAHYGVLDWGALDNYLTEIWLVPMGLI